MATKNIRTPLKIYKRKTYTCRNCVADRVRHDDGRQLRVDAMFARRRKKTRKIFTNNIERGAKKGRRASAFCWKRVNISWEKYTRQWFSGPMCPLDPWNVVNPFREMNGFFISGVYSGTHTGVMGSCGCVRGHHGPLLCGLFRGWWPRIRFGLDVECVLLDKSGSAICHFGVNRFYICKRCAFIKSVNVDVFNLWNCAVKVAFQKTFKWWML